MVTLREGRERKLNSSNSGFLDVGRISGKGSSWFDVVIIGLVQLYREYGKDGGTRQ